MDFKQNHFELFGLEPAFRIDDAGLEKAYREIQNQVHPDRFASKGQAEKRLSMQWAMQANEAYQTLRLPLTRADYFLHLQGIDALAATNTSIPPAFLMQQMEWREALASARSSRNMGTLDELMRDLRSEVTRLENEMALQIDDVKDFEAAAVSVRKLKFLQRLTEEIGDAREELELA
jgi:molecular chaperone HscB